MHGFASKCMDVYKDAWDNMAMREDVQKCLAPNSLRATTSGIEHAPPAATHCCSACLSLLLHTIGSWLSFLRSLSTCRTLAVPVCLCDLCSALVNLNIPTILSRLSLSACAMQRLQTQLHAPTFRKSVPLSGSVLDLRTFKVCLLQLPSCCLCHPDTLQS